MPADFGDSLFSSSNVVKFDRKTCAESTGKLLSMSDMQAWDADRAQARIRELERLPGALLPILHALQEEFGYVHPDALPLVAHALNISAPVVTSSACRRWKYVLPDFDIATT